ncbi:hypothetical protein O9929_00525 [Vibrio lentus]|nr:hypothetical protein [Vibrio lentus]
MELRWQAKPCGIGDVFTRSLVDLVNVNLLTGTFKTKSSFGKYWRVWQKVAIAACLLVAVIINKRGLEGSAVRSTSRSVPNGE